MTDWTAGYIADIGYTFGYYHELNPLRTKLAFLNAGLIPPDRGSHCELGFGQGVSANIHAAASGSVWYGTDFNPSQAGFAQALAQASGANAHLVDETFADFCHRADLPDFDSIGLHGIWSWISDENRAVIADFVRRKLKVGGVLYISYNTQPGWAAFAPMRHLITEHADVFGNEGNGIVNRIDGALEFVEKLMETSPIYARANPQVAERLKKIKGQDRNYLAHEYFNRDWHPMHFATMAKWLEPAKLSFACSAHYLDYVDALHLKAEQQAFLNEIPDRMFRESVRDFMVNQQFRRDYWVKGPKKIGPVDQIDFLRQQRVVLIKPRADVNLKVSGALGEANMQEAVYLPILDVLADYKPRTIGEMERAVNDHGVTFTQIIQAVLLLIGAGHLSAAQDDVAITRAKEYTDKLNASLIDKARGSSEIDYLASPVTGGGITAVRYQKLFLLALRQGKKKPADWALVAWNILASQGQCLIKEGEPLDTPEKNIAELTLQATIFSEKQLPVFQSLLIA